MPSKANGSHCSALCAEVGLLIGDFNRNGVADDNETTLALTLEEARDALSPGNVVKLGCAAPYILIMNYGPQELSSRVWVYHWFC